MDLCLSEDIFNLVTEGNRLKLYKTMVLVNEMIVSFHVHNTLMKNIIMSSLNGTLIVIVVKSASTMTSDSSILQQPSELDKFISGKGGNGSV